MDSCLRRNDALIMKTLKGKVIKGRGVGKKFGIPTANIKLNKDYQIPDSGVFSGFIFINNKKYKCAIFIGPRLTFDLSEPAIEAAIIDFSGDLYDNEVGLEIKEKIRDIEKFSSPEDLKEQITKDIEKVINS